MTTTYSFRRLAVRLSVLFIFTCVLCLPVLGGTEQPLASIAYDLKMTHPSSHLFEVGINVKIGGEGGATALDFQMPRWSPGRY